MKKGWLILILAVLFVLLVVSEAKKPPNPYKVLGVR
jgi:hypothetical protein